jgi:hypothetical protein
LIDEWVQLVSTVGFPIAAFLLIFWQSSTTQVELKNAINALENTIIKLCEKLNK